MQDVENMTSFELQQKEKDLKLYIQRAVEQKEEHLFPDLEFRSLELDRIRTELAKRRQL